MAKPVAFSWDLDTRLVEVERDYVDLADQAKLTEMLAEHESLITELQRLIRGQPMNQSELVESGKKMGASEREVKRVLEVGVGRLWVRRRGDKNAWIYTPLTNSPNTSNRIAD